MLKSNATYAFNYTLVHDDSTVEVNDSSRCFSKTPAPTTPPITCLRIVTRTAITMLTKQRAPGAVNKGIRYLSAHDCKTRGGKMYSTTSSVLTVKTATAVSPKECVKINQALGMERGLLPHLQCATRPKPVEQSNQDLGRDCGACIGQYDCNEP